MVLFVSGLQNLKVLTAYKILTHFDQNITALAPGQYVLTAYKILTHFDVTPMMTWMN